MAKIEKLDPHVADLIAAGEVVERPASVVKELAENAIDAGAKTVTVEIQRGGMSYIRVTDDGCGIAAEDCLTAFLRHATSKIRSESDLEAIGTLGFRGEALAAIASVSRVELMTRTEEEEAGTALLLDGGVLRRREAVGCPKGTTLIVRDLFFNTPARRKFLKRDTAEGSAVLAVVQRAALSHPEVSFRLLRDGKQDIQTPGDGDLRAAVYAVMGRDMALGLLDCRGGDEEIRVEGFLSRPVCCRGSRAGQFFFVNGRYIKSRTAQAALEQAYQNRKMVGKFPACVLHLTTRLSFVDVNVHPTKTEVKFAGEKKLFDAVYYAAMAALDTQEEGKAAEKEAQRPAEAAQDLVSPNQTFFREMNADAFRGMLRSDAAPVYDAHAPRRTPAPEPLGSMPASPDAAFPVQRRQTSAPRTDEKTKPVIQEAPPKAEEVPAPAWRLAGEVLRTYVIAERGDEVFVIDKHAAHERMNFDALKAAETPPMRQILLSPLILRLSPEEQEALLAQEPLLEEFGFSVADFGGGSLIVREAPDYLPVGEIESALDEIAAQLLETGSANPDDARDGVLRTMACKAAIKGGWQTADEELRAICEAVLSGEIRYCPHGRPVAIRLTRADFEKRFKRT